MGARDLSEAAARPRRERAERVVAAVQQPGAHHERVRRDDVHELRPRAVGGFGDRDEQLPVLRLALGDEGVAIADAEGGQHDRVGVAREGLGREQRFAHRL